MITSSCVGLFLRLDTWNVSCTPLSSSGNSNLYATVPILSKIMNGPMYHGFSFPRLPNLTTPFQGETFNNTLSPTSNSNGFRLRSA
ncbi:hypothetical protein Hanom_Chr02g00116951 [Helianthus anomalus]